MVICSMTLPRGSAMSDTMVFSEGELSDTDETDPVIEQSHESAPGPLSNFQRYDELEWCICIATRVYKRCKVASCCHIALYKCTLQVDTAALFKLLWHCHLIYMM